MSMSKNVSIFSDTPNEIQEALHRVRCGDTLEEASAKCGVHIADLRSELDRLRLRQERERLAELPKPIAN